MAEQSLPTSLPSQGWTFLARGDQVNDMIARCPGGHIHVDYGNLTIRFQQEEFLAFSRMVAEAADQLQDAWPNILTQKNKRSKTFSKN